MRIALLQTAGERGTVEPNLARLAEHTAAAAERGARLLVCPEMYLSGYNIDAGTMAALAENAEGPSSQRVAELARQTGIAVLYGYPERDGDAVYNAAKLIDSDGKSLANCRKSHLCGDLDRRAFTPGEQLVRARLNGITVGILICYDVEFPEAVRAQAMAGAAMVLVPTALTKPHDFVARSLVPARAWENQIFVAYADRCGSEGEIEYCGLSCIAGPDGEFVAKAGTAEALLVADIDLGASDRARRKFCYLDDRRPALYQSTTVGSGE